MNTTQLSYDQYVRIYREDLEHEYHATDPDEREIDCPDCHGDGSQDCDLGHIHDCEACDGSGETTADSFEDFAKDDYDFRWFRDKRRVKEYEQWLSQC